MPGLDGVEVMRLLAQEDCNATIIIVSGLGEKVLNAAKTAADESGLRVAGVLTKPFRVNALITLLDTYSNDLSNLSSRPSALAEISVQELKTALAERRLEVHYQPQIQCQSRTIAGFEALARIRGKQNDLIMPDRFIRLAEREGLIQQLTEQVFEQAIGWFAEVMGATDYTLSLNTSPSIFTDPDFPATLSRLCLNKGLAPHRIKLEVTETSTAKNASLALELLTQLRVKGFLLAIDDFGVGYSSLEQLVRQPFSELKIDKNFIIPIAQSEEAQKIAASLIALARALKLTTTAEGVEDELSLALLADAGCDLAQGFFISHPIAPTKILPWIKHFQSLSKASA